MKHLALFALTAAMLFSLAACGCQASDTRPGTNGGTTNSGTSNNSGTTNNGGTANNGSGANNGTANNRPGTATRPGNNSIGDDLEDAVDDVGDAVGDMFDGEDSTGGSMNGGAANNGTANNGTANNSTAADDAANPTGFQRMLDNARVHDVDGILTDGENSQW